MFLFVEVRVEDGSTSNIPPTANVAAAAWRSFSTSPNEREEMNGDEWGGHQGRKEGLKQNRSQIAK